MNTSKYIQKFNKLDQDLLTFRPWLWQTKIHFVTLSMAVFNLLVAASLFLNLHRGISYVCIVATITLIGFAYWLYEMSQITIEEQYAKLESKIVQQRFWTLLLGVSQFSFPNAMVWLARNPNQELFTAEAIQSNSFGIMAITAVFFVSLVIQIWSVIGWKTLSLTLLLNGLLITGFYFTMQMNVLVSALVVLLLAQLLVEPKKLVHHRMQSGADTQQERNLPASWIILGYSSLQLIVPILFGLGVFTLIMAFNLDVSLKSMLIVFVPMAVIGAVYLNYLLPHYLQTMANLKSLPKLE